MQPAEIMVHQAGERDGLHIEEKTHDTRLEEKPTATAWT